LNNDIKMEKYILAKDIRETLDILDKYGGKTRVVAGSTDLLPLVRRTKAKIDCLVDITGIDGLAYIEEEDGLIKIGALVTHGEVENSPLIRKRAFVLAEACGVTGSPQIKNKGTLVGNIVNASPAADASVALIILGAEAKIVSKAGERVGKVENIFLGPGKPKLAGNELVTELCFKILQPGQGGAFLKLAKRKGLAISVVNAAVLISLDESRGICRDARIAVGSVAPTPVRVKDAEKILIGQQVEEKIIEKASLTAMAEVKPIDDIRGSAGYRREMTKVLVARAIRKAIHRAGGE